MNHWLANSMRNLMPLSRAGDFQEALGEWSFTGEIDACAGVEAQARCQLCEHPELVHRFQIKNIHTERTLLVGSSCILKFAQIEVLNERGEVLAEESLRRKALDVALQRKILDRALEPLRMLWERDTNRRNQTRFLAEQIKDGQALTPRQLDDLFGFLDSNEIPFTAKLYRASMRSQESIDYVARMPSENFLRLLPTLSTSQLEKIRVVRGDA